MEVRLDVAEISVPLGEVDPRTRLPKNLNVGLEPNLSRVLDRMVSGLLVRGESIASGRQVRSAHQAIVWLLEQVDKNERK